MIRRIFTVLVIFIVIGAALGGVAAYQLTRPLPPVIATRSLASNVVLDGQPPALPWPGAGAAAIGIEGLGPLARYNDSRPRPIASVTKIMTAYLILLDHPLLPGDRGPTITITAADVETYSHDLADGQSVVDVQQGEQLTEYQLLQALLLPSGNNIADLLADWDSGSIDTFVATMNSKAVDLGMSDSHFADASGVSPQSVSTAWDLILLAQAAMDDPTFAEIVSQSLADLPVSGTVYNVNTVLGQGGIDGIKTGSTPEAGGCFVFAAFQQVAGKSTLVYGAILGQDQLSDALSEAAALAAAVPAGVVPRPALQSGEVVATFDAPWGAHANAVASGDINVLSWPGISAQLDVQLLPLNAPTPGSAKVGTATVEVAGQTQKVDVVTEESLDGPDWRWRLLRPLR